MLECVTVCDVRLCAWCVILECMMVRGVGMCNAV